MVEREVGGPVAVSEEVYAGLEAVRSSGQTNMLDRPRVARLCALLGHPAAARWVRRNKGLYAKGVFRGFAVGDGPDREGEG
jgi:hypothetical protein